MLSRVSFPLEGIVPKVGVELCGVHLKDGIIVEINPAVIHRDKAVSESDKARTPSTRSGG